MMHQYGYIFNKYFKITCLFLLVQQLIVASSTYFIAKLAAGVGAGDIQMQYAVLFVASLVVVYLPAYFCMVYLERAKYSAWQAYAWRFERYFLGQASFYADDVTKTTSLSMLAQESKSSIDETLNTVFDVLGLILNVVLNIVVFALMLDSVILLGYALGMAVAFFYLKRSRRINQVAQEAQQSRLAVISVLNHAWDNVVLNNQYNRTLYRQALAQKFDTVTAANVRCQAVRHVYSNVGMMLLLCPVMLMTAVIFYQHITQLELLAVLIATLPRQVQLLQVCYSLPGHHVNIRVICSRLQGLSEILSTPKPDLQGRICADKLKVWQTGQVFNPNALPIAGRMTLIADNGAGKSSQLLLLKEQLGEQAYYLPTKHHLYFRERMTGSTGQQLMAQFDEIAGLDVPVILLDEWDANLDAYNTAQLDARIDELALHKLIIEIRHLHKR